MAISSESSGKLTICVTAASLLGGADTAGGAAAGIASAGEGAAVASARPCCSKRPAAAGERNGSCFCGSAAGGGT